MLSTVASMLVGRFGPKIFSYIYWGVIAVLVALLGSLYLYNSGLSAKLDKKTQTLAKTEVELENTKTALVTAENNIIHYKTEYVRVSAIAEKAAVVRTELVYVDKVVTREVIKYQTDPSIKRVLLPAQWVCIHDYSAKGIDSFASTGEIEGKAFSVEDYQCIGKESIPDYQVLEVMNYNYQQCFQMQANYQELSDIVFGYLTKVAELESALKKK
jgi:hypothetical protein